jgi:flagellar biosynthetic protein FliO
MDYYLQILLFLVIFGAILLLAFYTTRFIALKAGSMMRGKHIRIVDTVSLGADKKLFLVKVGSRYFLLSSSGKNIEFISEIDDIEDSRPEYDIEKPGFRSGNEFRFNLKRLRKLVNRNYETGDEDQDNNAKKI